MFQGQVRLQRRRPHDPSWCAEALSRSVLRRSPLLLYCRSQENHAHRQKTNIRFCSECQELLGMRETTANRSNL